MIEAEVEKHFDPVIVEAFKAVYDELLAFSEAAYSRQGEFLAANLSDGV